MERENPTSVILEELRSLLVAINAERASPRKQPRFNWLNSPFVVTLVGGMIATMLALVWEDHSSKSQKNRDLAVESLRARQRVMVAFADDFSDTLQLLYNLAHEAAWLHINRRERTQHPDGRPFEDVKKHWENRLAEYTGSRSFVALCTEVQAFFPSGSEDSMPTVASAAQELQDAMRDLESSIGKHASIEDVRSLHDSAESHFMVLITSMGKEIQP